MRIGQYHPAWQTCLQYGRLFRPWLEGTPLAIEREWHLADAAPFIELSGRYGTRTAFAWVLEGERLAPDLRAFVDLSLAYARDKAARRRTGIGLLAAAMNKVGVKPLLLKGSAAQIGNVYPDPGFRVMADIDLLVPPERIGDSVRAAEAAGFRIRDSLEHGHSQPPQDHHELGLMLEIHHRITRVTERDNLPGSLLLAQASEADVGGATVLLPDWTMHAAVTLLHAMEWDGSRYMALVPFKALLDVAALKASGRMDDGSGLIDIMDRAGGRTTLEHAETLYRNLFGASLTAAPLRQRRARRIATYYALGASHPLLVRSGHLMIQLRHRVRALRHWPSRVRKLVSPAFYARILGDFREPHLSSRAKSGNLPRR